MARGGKREGAGRKANPDAAPKAPKTPKAATAKAESKKPEEPKKPEPVREYDNEVFEGILARMAMGETLALICAEGGMPKTTTVWRWKERDDDRRNAYARAREDQQQAWADQIVEIADDGTNDYVEKVRKDGSKDMAYDREHVDRSKLRIETRKWLMARLSPKSFGDKTALELSGKDGAPLVPVINVTIGGTESQPAS